MSLFQVFAISGSAVSAQSRRLNVVASNMANADSVAGPDGQSYKARQVSFAAQALPGTEVAGVRVSGISENQAPGRRVLEPANPMADADGYVTHSNVSVIDEMVNMMSASRSYQNNLEVMNTARTLLSKTLQMGQ
ncbi:MAG: flagellar basal body rod protein FlgC [Burkholderiaceae bacterium]|nr:flagellar basal body rod protein FlgC [Burkholderiaceae bacterium]